MHKASFYPKCVCLMGAVVHLTGCAVQSIHDRSYVSDSLRTRVGQELRAGEKVELELPEQVSLSDGLSEDEAVAIALWNNAQFQADMVMLGFARADLIEAGMLRNPILSLLFPLGPKQLEATLNLPIDFFWQRPKRVAAARLNAEQVADSLVQHGLDLIRDVMIAFAELELTRERAALVEEEAFLLREIADIASARLAAGDISGLEETALRLEAARMRDMALGYARDAVVAEERLKTLLGLGLEDISLELTRPESRPPLSLPDADDLLTAAFAARPELRAAEISIERAGHRLGWERSRVLNLTAVLDANGEGREGFEMGPGLQMELPVLNWNNANISRAQAELAQAARGYLVVKNRIAREVREAGVRYRSARQSLQMIRRDILPAAEESAKNAEAAYSIGEISYLEFLDFKRQLIESRLRDSEGAAELDRALADLKHSLGFEPDMSPGTEMSRPPSGSTRTGGGHHD